MMRCRAPWRTVTLLLVCLASEEILHFGSCQASCAASGAHFFFFGCHVRAQLGLIENSASGGVIVCRNGSKAARAVTVGGCGMVDDYSAYIVHAIIHGSGWWSSHPTCLPIPISRVGDNNRNPYLHYTLCTHSRDRHSQHVRIARQPSCCAHWRGSVCAAGDDAFCARLESGGCAIVADLGIVVVLIARALALLVVVDERFLRVRAGIAARVGRASGTCGVRPTHGRPHGAHVATRKTRHRKGQVARHLYRQYHKQAEWQR